MRLTTVAKQKNKKEVLIMKKIVLAIILSVALGLPMVMAQEKRGMPMKG